MTAADAVRYLDWRGQECRDRDTHEALCLLVPAILAALNLEPMRYEEAWAFHRELKKAVNQKKAPGLQPGACDYHERVNPRIHQRTH